MEVYLVCEVQYISASSGFVQHCLDLELNSFYILGSFLTVLDSLLRVCWRILLMAKCLCFPSHLRPFGLGFRDLVYNLVLCPGLGLVSRPCTIQVYFLLFHVYQSREHPLLPLVPQKDVKTKYLARKSQKLHPFKYVVTNTRFAPPRVYPSVLPLSKRYPLVVTFLCLRKPDELIKPPKHFMVPF